MKVPENIQHAFILFILKGGYKFKRTPCGVQYYKAGKEPLFISISGKLNQAMQERWDLFCKMWLKNGKEFLEKLGLVA